MASVSIESTKELLECLKVQKLEEKDFENIKAIIDNEESEGSTIEYSIISEHLRKIDSEVLDILEANTKILKRYKGFTLKDSTMKILENILLEIPKVIEFNNISSLSERNEKVMRVKKEYYDLSMALLALIVVIMLIIEMTMNLTSNWIYIMNIVDNFIWVIFCIDYFIRLMNSKSKKKFILSNKIDLISIIPFNSLFKALRVVKITRVAKLVKITKVLKATVFLSKFKVKIDKFIKTNNFNYVIYMTGLIVGIGAIIISFVEGMDLGDALWWSFVTSTTVGYGDLSPVTAIGRVVAAVLMLVGIGFIGMLTGTIATYFLGKKEENITYRDSLINDVKYKLDNFENLTREDIKDIYIVLDSLKVKESSK